MDMPPVGAVLARIPLFQGLAPDMLEPIAAAARLVEAPRGTVLFNRGDHCHGFYVVIQGQVKLSVTSERGDEKVVEIIGRGHSFGEAMIFLGMDYVVSASTLADSTLVFVPKNVLLSELERDPMLARRMLASLSMRLRRLISDIEDYSLLSGRERVVGFLLHQAEPEDGGTGEVHLPFKKALVASRLNVTQEHFSRILHQLTQEGLIVVEGSDIHIPDVERLRRG